MEIEMMENNLDYVCAEYGQKISRTKDDETIVQKSLGVLQEDGLFAFVVYLESKKQPKDKEIVERILKSAADLLNKIELEKDIDETNIREKIHEITKNIDDMFLAKELLERTLIYARYHAKALTEESEK